MTMFKKILKIFTTEKKLLGRWNYINKEKYMDWANSDNCYQRFVKDIRKAPDTKTT